MRPPRRVCAEAAKLKPSARNELEITDLNNAFLKRGELQVLKMGRGIAWLDTGTHQSLMDAASFVQTVQDRQGLMVACLEEIALMAGWIGTEEVKAEAERMGKSPYSSYLRHLLAPDSTIQ